MNLARKNKWKLLINDTMSRLVLGFTLILPGCTSPFHSARTNYQPTSEMVENPSITRTPVQISTNLPPISDIYLAIRTIGDWQVHLLDNNLSEIYTFSDDYDDLQLASDSCGIIGINHTTRENHYLIA
ncbi:MAG: hypothetical protein FJZ98_04795 [Chloroflexi bacterium]|nr:hypothetical protein [Chloroflexota bacterium]